MLERLIKGVGDDGIVDGDCDVNGDGGDIGDSN